MLVLRKHRRIKFDNHLLLAKQIILEVEAKLNSLHEIHEMILEVEQVKEVPVSVVKDEAVKIHKIYFCKHYIQ